MDIRARGLLWIVFLLIFWGCGEDGTYVVSDIQIERQGWDSLEVAASFGHRSDFWGLRPAPADTTEMLVTDSRFDTLYVGPVGRISLPDRRLADREKVLVEVCGVVHGSTACRQQSITASPKRIQARTDIQYPVRGAIESGRYEINLTVERGRWKEAGWEEIHPGTALDAYMLATVQSPSGQESPSIRQPNSSGREQNRAAREQNSSAREQNQSAREQNPIGGDGAPPAQERTATDSVRVPLDLPSGRFALQRQENFDDYIYQINSSLYEGREAQVTFDVYAGINGNYQHLETIRKSVRSQTRSEQMQSVWQLVRSAAGVLLDRLGKEDRARTRAYVDDWSYNEIVREYTIRLELVWEEERTFFWGDEYEMEGTLHVSPSGDDAEFTFSDGNRRARERWNEVYDRSAVTLPRLEITPPQEERPDDGRRGDDDRNLREA